MDKAHFPKKEFFDGGATNATVQGHRRGTHTRSRDRREEAGLAKKKEGRKREGAGTP